MLFLLLLLALDKTNEGLEMATVRGSTGLARGSDPRTMCLGEKPPPPPNLNLKTQGRAQGLGFRV